MKVLNEPCLLWTGRLGHNGYGRKQLCVNGRTIRWRVHRLAWVLARGPIPGGLLVLHSCDNRACYRLSHLRLGTQSENIREMDSKGRRGRYEVLNQELARWVRFSKEYSGQPIRLIAEEFGVSQDSVKKAIAGGYEGVL